jgi:hypothetical protein
MLGAVLEPERRGMTWERIAVLKMLEALPNLTAAEASAKIRRGEHYSFVPEDTPDATYLCNPSCSERCVHTLPIGTTAAEARVAWARALVFLDENQACAEIHQALLDAIDAREQSDLESAVLRALGAFEGK